jgi:tetratricopeptide (TPR) repeat protein
LNRKLRRAAKIKNKKARRKQGSMTDSYPEAAQDFADAMRLHQAGQFEEARVSYQRVLSIQPDHSVALHHLGVIALQAGNSEEAVKYIGMAVKVQPTYAFAHNNLGNALKNTGRIEDAKPAYTTAISQKADYAEAYYNRAIVWDEIGNSEAAQVDYKKAIDLKAEYLDAKIGLGALLNKVGEHEESLAYFEQVLTIDAKNMAALNNRGNVLEELGRLDDALESYDLALKISPTNADILVNKGNVLKDLRRIDEAFELYNKAVDVAPQSAKAHYNRGLSCLMTGDLEKGWDDYQWRWQNTALSMQRPVTDKPVWDGTDLNGKTILLYPEQGKGDEVQFARYIPLVAERGGRVVLWASRPMLRLLSGVSGAAIVCDTLEGAGSYDCHASLMDLPGIFRTSLETIPNETPYLNLENDLLDIWSGRLGPKENLRVGLVWAGNPAHKNDRNRSIDLELFQPLSEIKELSLFSLQVGQSEKAAIVLGSSVRELEKEIKDFADTAAAISALDLVISVDTAVAHVAGALGKPVWTLLPFIPDWRWLLDRDDSPWYPSMRLFRQDRPGDWSGVITNVVTELSNDMS